MRRVLTINFFLCKSIDVSFVESEKASRSRSGCVLRFSHTDFFWKCLKFVLIFLAAVSHLLVDCSLQIAFWQPSAEVALTSWVERQRITA